MNLCRYCDLILDFIKKNGEIQRPDVINIMEIFEAKVTETTYFKLSSDLERILDIKIPDYNEGREQKLRKKR